MSTDITEEKRGISRRDLIKKGAVAGAVVWTVPFIESVPAYASTGSGTFTGASYAWIAYIDSTNHLYLASYGKNATPCTQGTNNCPLGPVTVQLNNSSTGSLTIDQFNGSPNIKATLDSQTVTTTDCSHLDQSGNTITAQAGYTIVGVVAFGGNQGGHCQSAYVAGTNNVVYSNANTNIVVTGTGNGNSVTITGL